MKNYRAVFRVDSSVDLGSGHVMRCLTLADVLVANGVMAIFICSPLSGDMSDYIRQKGHKVLLLTQTNTQGEFLWENDARQVSSLLASLEQPIGWLIIDQYQIDIKWEKIVRPCVGNILVIDDLANREHSCEILLDQNYYLNMQQRYCELVPTQCRQLLGPTYALLRQEFLTGRKELCLRDGWVRRILVFFGGSDPTGETMKVLKAIRDWNRSDVTVNVIVGNSNRLKDEIYSMCLTMPNTSFDCQVDNMAEFMMQADLAIGAGGSATWERCCLGLPAIVIVVADNQAEVTDAVASTGAIVKLGSHGTVDESQILATLIHLSGHPEVLRKISRQAFSLMGDQLIGGAERILREMEKIDVQT